MRGSITGAVLVTVGLALGAYWVATPNSSRELLSKPDFWGIEILATLATFGALALVILVLARRPRKEKK